MKNKTLWKLAVVKAVLDRMDDPDCFPDEKEFYSLWYRMLLKAKSA